MRALPVLDELSRATQNEVRLGILRGTDVLHLQPPRHRPTSASTLNRCSTASRRHTRQPRAKLCWPSPPPRSSTTSSRRVARVHTAHHHLARRPAPETLRHPADADRDITERIRHAAKQLSPCQSSTAEAGRRRHRTHRRGPGQRTQAGRQRTVRCVPQSLPPTRHRVTREAPTWSTNGHDPTEFPPLTFSRRSDPIAPRESHERQMSSTADHVPSSH